mmetsp:Transcript_9588/g.31929  ORF Transcript_9588/g.31929 Transcript_9588/m.31929 type:complete len:231 (+) Transcript_9588:1017-1709(+)
MSLATPIPQATSDDTAHLLRDGRLSKAALLRKLAAASRKAQPSTRSDVGGRTRAASPPTLDSGASLLDSSGGFGESATVVGTRRLEGRSRELSAGEKLDRILAALEMEVPAGTPLFAKVEAVEQAAELVVDKEIGLLARVDGLFEAMFEVHLGEEKGDGSAYDGAYLPRERLDHAMYSLGIAWAASESLDQDVQVVEEALGTEKGPGTKLEERIDAICTELGLPEGADEV